MAGVKVNIDLENLEEQKTEVIKIFGELFTELKSLSEKNTLPVNMTGFTQLQQNVQQTTKDVAQLTKNVTALNTSLDVLSKTAKNLPKDPIPSKVPSSAPVKELTNAYTAMKQKITELKGEYAELVKTQEGGKNAPAAIAKLEEIAAAKKEFAGITKEIDNAGESGLAFGNVLKGVYNQVRILAYVIPGIGIAGIFNLAFQAIEQALEELNLFNESLEVEIKRQTDVNKGISESIDLHQRLYEIELDSFRISKENYEGDERDLENKKARGYDVLTIAKQEADVRAKERDDSQAILFSQHASIEAAIKDRDRLKAKIDETTAAYDKQKDLLDKLNDPKKLEELRRPVPGRGPAIPILPTKEQTQARLDFLKSELDKTNKLYDQAKAQTDKYFADNLAANEAYNNYVKILEEQQRALRISNAQKTMDGIVDVDEKTLHATRSTEEQLLAAVKEAYEARKVFITKENQEYQASIEHTDYEKGIHANETTTKLKELAIKEGEDLQKITDEFNERRLRAVTENAILESQAREKVYEETYQDETKSYEDRMTALKGYLNERKIQLFAQYTAEVALQSIRYTTPEEKKATEEKFDSGKQQLILTQAKAASEITASFISKSIRDLKEQNEQFYKTTDTEEEYTKALETLNDRFEKGAISAKRFKDSRDKLNESYTLATDIDKIKADEKAIANDQKKHDELTSQLNIGILNRLELQQEGKDKEADIQEHNNEQIRDGIKKNDDLILADKKKKADDEKKYQDDRNKLLLKDAEDNKVDWLKIEKALYEASTELLDAWLEHEIEAIERRKKAVDDMYDSEVEAIQRSTLAEKEKQAYEIQAKAQKEAYDRAAAKRERKLKHDEAIYDKALTAADIIFSTYKAFASDIGKPWKQVTDIILGAIALAKVAATPIPALKYGTEDWEGGRALVGEAGTELIKEPGKKPYVQSVPAIKFLPLHTEVIPTYDIPEISDKKDNSWQQTKYLAAAFLKSQKKIDNKVIVKNNINFGFEIYKSKIIYGRLK